MGRRLFCWTDAVHPSSSPAEELNMLQLRDMVHNEHSSVLRSDTCNIEERTCCFHGGYFGRDGRIAHTVLASAMEAGPFVQRLDPG